MHQELAPEVEARMRPTWKIVDEAIRTDLGVVIEIANLARRASVDVERQRIQREWEQAERARAREELAAVKRAERARAREERDRACVEREELERAEETSDSRCAARGSAQGLSNTDARAPAAFRHSGRELSNRC
ncbi:hypothetical protein E4V99_12200 [Microbacterium sp. dk485]|uniref:hypothetical protein n=1 Tax=Microbacterium sp. dk485 TaxID=2560021 RepID=UPI001073BBB0|nr:hypothetical protein [Microbacterium sp. dk485]TFV81730.1 hypothetical protein E4V99_12200 [Microbacterium sp. dk485]